MKTTMKEFGKKSMTVIKGLLIVIVMLGSSSAYSQEETLLGTEVSSTGYGAFFTKIGPINGGVGIFMGGQGSWIMNHRLGFGAKGYGLINEVDIAGMDNIKLDFGCYGGLVEYVIASDKLVHLNVSMMIGAGGVNYAVADYSRPHVDVDYAEDAFFVMEPSIDAELNINTKMRICAGLSYRYVNGVHYEGLTDADLSGVSGQVTIKFGLF